MKTIERLESWLETSKCTASKTFCGVNPTISEVEEMLAEVKGMVTSERIKQRINDRTTRSSPSGAKVVYVRHCEENVETEGGLGETNFQIHADVSLEDFFKEKP